jgi:hypothetical protein
MPSTENTFESEIPYQEEPSVAVNQIKDEVLKIFGKVIDLQTMQTQNRKWEELNLNGNCGKVAEITQRIVGGEVKKIINNKDQAEIRFKSSDGEAEIVIADGLAQAVHAYVVSQNGKVWDPILEIWGSVKEQDYLSHIHKN